MTGNDYRLISIHTPLAGSDPNAPVKDVDTKFQSTLPLRGATEMDRASMQIIRISIHTPLAGSDLASEMGISRQAIFQSTLPLRGATAEMRHF